MASDYQATWENSVTPTLSEGTADAGFKFGLSFIHS